MDLKNLKKSDPRLYKLIAFETQRQRETIDLIASENFVSAAILEVLGSALTNKYSEGYPGKRYYPGNFYYDEIEKLAQKRALKAFNLSPEKWSVNVQPYSGSPANLAIYSALMKRGDILMGMSLSSGGHLTHGHKASISGQLYKAVQYGVYPKTGLLDYDEIRKLAKKYKPRIIISGASAYPRKIDFKKFGEIAKSVGAYHLADISHIAGLIAAGLHPSPFPNSDIVMTTTHKTLRGPRAAVIFSRNSKLKTQNSKLSIAEAIDRAVFPGMQGGPHNNVIAAIALAFFEATKPGFKKYQKQVVANAKALAESLKKFGFKLLTGGTDNHLLIIDLRSQYIDASTISASTLSIAERVDGLMAEKKLEAAGILTSRSALPGDKSPYKPSGLRLGTPAATTQGVEEKEMKKIAEWIYRVLLKKESLSLIKKEIKALYEKFPIC